MHSRAHNNDSEQQADSVNQWKSNGMQSSVSFAFLMSVTSNNNSM